MPRALPRIARDVPKGQRKPNLRVRVQHHAFIRLLPCVACGKAAPSECAHVRRGADGGTGLKPSSRYTVPLCRGPDGCHARQHRVGELTFWSELGIDPLDIACRLWTVTGDTEQGIRAIERAHQAIALHRSGSANELRVGV